MIFKLFGRKKAPPAGALLYQSLASAARTPALFSDFGIPDTLDGRLEALMLVTGLAVDRLTREDDAALNEGARMLAREVSESFFDDMDRTLREMGISDVGVPKKVRKIAKGFYGRMTAYAEALHSADGQAFHTALSRNVPPDAQSGEGDFQALAQVLRSFYQELQQTPLDELRIGLLRAAAVLDHQPAGGTLPEVRSQKHAAQSTLNDER